jgi:NTP pyrophosphatase (non-canonical NTP hydrolase)
MRKVCKWKACEKYRHGSQKSYQTKRESRGDEEVKPEEARDILSDMRDQHLQFIDGVENTGTWGEKFLKEAWACNSGEKALAGLITKIKIDKGVVAESILHYGKNNQSTVCMEECAELIQAISKAKRGKIDRDNMIEEIADVLICIEMLKQMYMISDEKINKWIEKKQAREAERMEKNE